VAPPKRPKRVESLIFATEPQLASGSDHGDDEGKTIVKSKLRMEW
jgi:hypothetical protein